MLNDSEYPEESFTPLHPKFIGRCRVAKADHMQSGDSYVIELDTGECSCDNGAAWVWNAGDSKWTPNKYCIHKLKALASLTAKDYDELVWPYVKALATRYNRYEVVSAFHKELRRGDEEKAWFWGSILMAFRGSKGVVTYMQNILYEETRDHKLGAYLMKLQKNKPVDIANVCKAVLWFCRTPKKWELPGRIDTFTGEMEGYSRLVEKYGRNVAKPAEQIDDLEYQVLKNHLLFGIDRGNLSDTQYGLKGLLKLKHRDGDDQDRHRARIMSMLTKRAQKNSVDGYSEMQHDILLRGAMRHPIGYHDLNALCDLIAGEPHDYGCLPVKSRRMLLKRPKTLPIALGKWPKVPLYAHDNHTWGGKAAIRRYPGELKPGAKQEHLDLRWCGAYFGVAWRMLAYDQFGTCDVEWGKVKWPKKLHTTVNELWY